MSRARQMLKELKGLFTNQKCIKKYTFGVGKIFTHQGCIFFFIQGEKTVTL